MNPIISNICDPNSFYRQIFRIHEPNIFSYKVKSTTSSRNKYGWIVTDVKVDVGKKLSICDLLEFIENVTFVKVKTNNRLYFFQKSLFTGKRAIPQ